MKQIIVVTGPTATGKTEYAIKLSNKFNGELINADSRQIYKYLDIGTNKGSIKSSIRDLIRNKNQVSNFEIQNVLIHLINLIEPDERYDLYRFKKAAWEKIQDIISRNKTPVLVGGTGLYIDSIIKNYSLGSQNTNPKLRNELEKLNIIELQNRIKERPQELNDSDWNNPRRLIRYIERHEMSNQLQVDQSNSSSPDVQGSFEFKIYYPIYNWEELKLRINNRVEKMFKDGLVDETKRVLEMGFPKDSPGLQIMGYKEAAKYLNGLMSLEECINLVQTAHRQYARKQRTWFEAPGRNYKLERVDFTNDVV